MILVSRSRRKIFPVNVVDVAFAPIPQLSRWLWSSGKYLTETLFRCTTHFTESSHDNANLTELYCMNRRHWVMMRLILSTQ